MPMRTILLLQATQLVAPAPTYDITPPREPVDLSVTAAGCHDSEVSDDIVVCSRRDDERYRLPIPRERDPRSRLQGEAMTGMDALNSDKPCGIFAGQRQCSKKEAAEYGYGNGRDPITFLSRIVKKVAGDD